MAVVGSFLMSMTSPVRSSWLELWYRHEFFPLSGHFATNGDCYRGPCQNSEHTQICNAQSELKYLQ